MGKRQVPRGIRNNNPLNIRHSSASWFGACDVQTDRDFVQFRDMLWGLRAAMVIIRNYRRHHGLQTVSQIINRWAPPAENDTGSYLHVVCQVSGLRPESVIDGGDRDRLAKLVWAMAYVECGQFIDYNLVNAAYDYY